MVVTRLLARWVVLAGLVLVTVADAAPHDADRGLPLGDEWPRLVRLPFGTGGIDVFQFTRGGQNVATDAAGRFAVVWTANDIWSEPRRGRGYLTVVDATGQVWEPANKIMVELRPGELRYGAVVAGDEGDFFCAFTVWDLVLGHSRAVRLQHVDRFGTPWTGPDVALEVADPGPPVLVRDGVGGVVLCVESRQEGDIVCQGYDASGEARWPGTVRPAAGQWRRSEPQVLADDGGGAYVFWLETAPPAVLGQHLSPTGERLWGEAGAVVVSLGGPPVSYTEHHYKVVQAGREAVFVAYEDVDPVAQKVVVQAQRLGSDGAPLWATPVRVDPLSVGHRLDDVVAGPQESVFVLTHDEDLWVAVHRILGDGEQAWGADGRRVRGSDNIAASAGFANGILAVVRASGGEDRDFRTVAYSVRGELMPPESGVTAHGTTSEAQYGVAVAEGGHRAILTVYHEWDRWGLYPPDTYGLLWILDPPPPRQGGSRLP